MGTHPTTTTKAREHMIKTTILLAMLAMLAIAAGQAQLKFTDDLLADDLLDEASATRGPCTNKRTAYMIDNGLTCEDWKWIRTNRCNGDTFRMNGEKHSEWLKNKWHTEKYCQQSCWDHKVGYDGDDCSTPTPAPIR